MGYDLTYWVDHLQPILFARQAISRPEILHDPAVKRMLWRYYETHFDWWINPYLGG